MDPNPMVRVEGQPAEGGKAIDTIHGRIVNVDIDIDANGDGEIDDTDETLETNPGGFVAVGTNSLARINLKVEPAGLPGKVKLTATGGDRIRLWTTPARTTEVVLPATWNSVADMPSELYVEGLAPSAAVQDVSVRLEYDLADQLHTRFSKGAFDADDEFKPSDTSNTATLYASALPNGHARSVSFPLDGASFQFGASGNIGLGGVSVNSKKPFSSAGEITLSISCYQGNYFINGDASIVLTLHDVFDYYTPGFIANISDSSKSAAMIQCGFGKSQSRSRVGQVGLVEVEISGNVSIAERRVAP